MPAPPNFVQNLVKHKFDATKNVAQEQCAICLIDYTNDDEIITLPCDAKHYFHPDCIYEWLNKNNCCPLCKAPITKEALDRQKKQTRTSIKRN